LPEKNNPRALWISATEILKLSLQSTQTSTCVYISAEVMNWTLCNQTVTGLTTKPTACTGKLNLCRKMVETNLILPRHSFRFSM